MLHWGHISSTGRVITESGRESSPSMATRARTASSIFAIAGEIDLNVVIGTFCNRNRS